MNMVKNAKLVNNGKYGSNGLLIEFDTKEQISTGTVVQVEVNDKLRSFKVKEVKISGVFYPYLTGTAIEHGNHNSFLSKDKTFDIRELLDINVEIIRDKETLDKINQESMNC